jgi:hypothetical protein
MGRPDRAFQQDGRTPMRTTIRAFALLTAFWVLPAALSTAADKAQTASGTVSRLDAAHQTLVVKVGSEEVKFVWNAETRINGVLAPSAKVTVRYAAQPDGQNLAYQISVGR